jgi:F-type H+-transporting ATPase subunit alpha
VSRVGGKAQQPGHRAATAGLKLAYSQFEELETFTRFGARLDERTRGIIEHGRRIRECLKQGEHEHVGLGEQIVLLLALGAGLFDEIPLERMRDAQQRVRRAAAVLGESLLQRITAAASPSDADRESVLHAARAALAELRASP